GILILATIIGAVGFDPTILIGAIAAVVGGMVVFGSNTSTLKQTMTDMKAAEAHRTELISSMDLRVVGDGEIENDRKCQDCSRACAPDPRPAGSGLFSGATWHPGEFSEQYTRVCAHHGVLWRRKGFLKVWQ